MPFFSRPSQSPVWLLSVHARAEVSKHPTMTECNLLESLLQADTSEHLAECPWTVIMATATVKIDVWDIWARHVRVIWIVWVSPRLRSGEYFEKLSRILTAICAAFVAYFFCGTDGMCGGAGAKCISGDAGCLSNSCSEVINSPSPGVCSSPPAEGVPEGSACSVDENCESGIGCDGQTFLCTRALAIGPSQAARMRTKRDGSSHYNPKDKRGKVSSWFRSHTYCATGQTACSTVGGFEVSCRRRMTPSRFELMLSVFNSVSIRAQH